MKRKLSALLAIVLAVVMVFPTAVFVGADGTALTGMKVNIEGYSEETTKEVTTTSGAITIVEGGVIKITPVITDETRFKLGKITLTNNSSAVNRTDAGTESTVEIVGNTAGKSASLAIEVLGAQSESLIETCVITITCETVKIVSDKAYVSALEYEEGDEGEFNVGDNHLICEAGTVVVGGEVTAYKNNGDVNAVSTTKVEFSLDGETYGEKVTLTEEYDSKYLYVRYTFDGIANDTATGKKYVILTVKGTPFKSMSLSTNDRAEAYAGEVTIENFNKNNVVVKVNDNIIAASNYELKVYNKNTEKEYTDNITKDNYTGLKFVVNFEGHKQTGNVADFIEFKKDILVDFDINFNSATLKTYYVGQTWHEVNNNSDDGYEGVVVTIYYDSDDDGEYDNTVVKNGKEIKDLGLVFAEFSLNSVKAETVEVTYKEGLVSKTKNIDITALDVVPEKVIGITHDSSDMKISYKEGETLDLSGLEFTITYNNGKTELIKFNKNTNNFTDSKVTCNPGHGAELNKTLNYISVAYRVEGNEYVYDEIDITVGDATASTPTVKSIKLLSSSSAKRDYFLGESFVAEGFEFIIVLSNGESIVGDLGDATSVTLDSKKYTNTDGFKNTYSDTTVDVTFSYEGVGSDGETYKLRSQKLTLTGITVTKRPTLQSIVATSSKDTYMVGDAPEVQEITITAKYDDNNTRVFRIADDTTDANKVKTSYSITTGGVTYTMKLTPTRIDEDTTDIRVTYTEKITGGTTTTKYYDIEIEVVVPEAILSYYDGGWQYEPYMDFDEALDAAQDYADTLTSSYQQSRKPSIQLCKDITVLYDYSVTEFMEIDLNGFDITMNPGEIFVKSNSYAEITFVNNGEEDSMIIYSKTNDDDNIIIAEDDSYVIDAETGDGKYEVIITKPTNGKVTGPEEVTHGHDATFTITPDDGYVIVSIKINNKTQTVPDDGILIVENVKAKLTVTVTFQKKEWDNPFTDVYKSATYYKSVQFVYENGLFSGMSATKFEPDSTMSRAMFITVLGRLAGIDAEEAAARYGETSDFNDVSMSDPSISYAVPYINWASNNGLIEADENGNFYPKNNILHIDMYVFLHRYAAFIEKLNTDASGANIAANDVKDIPAWEGAYEAVEYAAKNNFLITSSNRLTPNDNAKRSELAMLLHKFCTNVLNWDNSITNDTIYSEDSSSFNSSPYITEDNGKYHLNITTTVSGRVYYYFTNEEIVPSASEYDGEYSAAVYKGEFYVVSAKNYSEEIITSELAQGYDYIIIQQVTDNIVYAPVSIKVALLGTGFTVDPYVSSNEEISFRAEHDGTVYWYFTKYNTVPAMDDFMDEYYDAASARRGYEIVRSTSSYTSFTFDSSYVQQYPYIAIMLMDTNDDAYQPVLVDVKNTTATGFSVEPYCDLTEEAVYFKAGQSGTVYYYFSRTSIAYNESSEDFWESYASAKSGSYGSYSVNTSFDYIPFSDIDTDYYPGIMIMLVDDENNDFYPVYVSLKRDGSAGNSTTGVTVLSVTGSTVELSVDKSGTLTYYFVGYGTNTTSHYGGGTIYVSQNSVVTIDHPGKYYYLVVELDDYDPHTIDLTTDYDRDKDVNDGSNKSGYGFSSQNIDFSDGQIIITGVANTSGTVTASISTQIGSEESVSVTKGEVFTIILDYDIDSFMNSSIGQLIGAGSLYVQLTSGSDVYERWNVNLG